MANRFTTALDDAGNSSGSSSVVRSDWHSGVADSMSARDTQLPLQMPDIRLQVFPQAKEKISSATCRGSPYKRVRVRVSRSISLVVSSAVAHPHPSLRADLSLEGEASPRIHNGDQLVTLTRIHAVLMWVVVGAGHARDHGRFAGMARSYCCFKNSWGYFRPQER